MGKGNKTAEMQQKKKNIIILGAGISGLQTAVRLLEGERGERDGDSNGKGEKYEGKMGEKGEEKMKVTIVAQHFPGDVSLDYCSPWAGADWRSHCPRPKPLGVSDPSQRMRDWEALTYSTWRSQILHAQESHSQQELERGKGIGMDLTPCIYYLGSQYQGEEIDEGGVWFDNLVDNYSDLDITHPDSCPGYPIGELGMGVKKGVRFDTVCVDVNTSLSRLMMRFRELGGKSILMCLDGSSGWEGVISSLKNSGYEDLQEMNILINCLGLSARKFVEDDERRKLFPVRGQTVLVKGEAERCYTYVGSVGGVDGAGEDELCYVIPRPGSGTTIFGGCKQVGNWRESVDEELTGRILKRVRGLGWGGGLVSDGSDMDTEANVGSGMENGFGFRGKWDEEPRRKKTYRKEGFEVISEQVGFRPGREGGPRVEVQGVVGGVVGGVWVLHNYGHAGAGWQCSVGCAEEVGRLVRGLGA